LTKTKQPSTPFAPAERRAGTYERDDDVVALLQYGTPLLLDVPRHRERLTLGKASDRDLVLTGEHVSAHHAILERRSRGLIVTDDASRNGLAFARERNLGLRLRPSFEDQRAPDEGFLLTPGMTFVVGAEPDRFLALDDAMRAAYPALTEILGRDDEIQRATDGGETPSPSDLIIAADGPGHLLITGKLGCGHEELARIVHGISKRRSQRLVERDGVPEDRAAQNALLSREASKATLVLHLGTNRKRLDPAFVSSMFMSSYQIRVIVTARTANQARRALGHQHWRPLLHVALRPMAERRIAIHRLLDQMLTAQDSPLRVADLTPGNQRALLVCPWRKNLLALREAAVRLDAIARAGFSRKKAADLLGVPVQTFYHWFGGMVRLTKPLVPDKRARELVAALSSGPAIAP
jgi:hypothetical protein